MRRRDTNKEKKKTKDKTEHNKINKCFFLLAYYLERKGRMGNERSKGQDGKISEERFKSKQNPFHSRPGLSMMSFVASKQTAFLQPPHLYSTHQEHVAWQVPCF